MSSKPKRGGDFSAGSAHSQCKKELPFFSVEPGKYIPKERPSVPLIVLTPPGWCIVERLNEFHLFFWTTSICHIIAFDITRIATSIASLYRYHRHEKRVM